MAAGLLALAAAFAAVPLAAHAQAQPCTPVTARVVSLQGTIALRSAAQEQWQPVRRLDTPLCRGDRLRTGANSRAALFIPPENLLRVDQNTTVSVHIDADETIVEFFIDAGSQGNACGAGYAISRFPRKFKIHTPFSYAAVEGTEFLVAMTCSSATVSVFEGKVSVEQRIAQASRVLLESGQTTTVGPDQPPAVQVLVKPVDAVQWALYYPPIADPQFGADPVAVDCEAIAEEIRPASQ
ncbi:MAG: FecR domain-containing protein, partial [Parvularculaceae bacterium]|nr:FecR domain-containing protein [Parvularculaceae bacterium]